MWEGDGTLTWRRVHGGYTGEEVSCEAIAAGGGCGVWSVGGDHVVDCGHVDTILEVVGVRVDTFRNLLDDVMLTFAIAIKKAPMRGAIQGIGGPREVHAKIKRPIVSSGATIVTGVSESSIHPICCTY